MCVRVGGGIKGNFPGIKFWWNFHKINFENVTHRFELFISSPRKLGFITPDFFPLNLTQFSLFLPPLPSPSPHISRFFSSGYFFLLATRTNLIVKFEFFWWINFLKKIKNLFSRFSPIVNVFCSHLFSKFSSAKNAQIWPQGFFSSHLWSSGWFWSSAAFLFLRFLFLLS